MYWAASLIVAVFGLALLAYRLRAERIGQERQERQRSIEIIRYLRQLLELLQRHRGLCFGYMSGEGSLQRQLWTVYQQIEELLARGQDYDASLYWYPGWHDVREGWALIRARDDLPETTPEAMLAQHNGIVTRLLDTIRELADKHDLVRMGGLATHPRGFWMALLEDSELLGQARGLGTGIAARRQNTPQQREALGALRQQIAERAYLSLAALHADPTLRRDYGDRIKEAEHGLDALLGLIDRLLETEGEGAIRSIAYFRTATAAISAHLRLVDLLLERLTDA
jgi:hypothetical protein